MVPFFQSSGKVPNSKQLRNIMRNGVMVDEQLSLNILTDTIMTMSFIWIPKDWIAFSILS